MMAANQSNRGHFVGSQRIAAAEDLDAFVRRASPGAEFVYAEAPEPPRASLTWARARDLAADGLISTHHRRRAGGGWEYFAIRTAKALIAQSSPQESALADPATDLIFRALKWAVNFGRPCPSDAELGRAAGCSRDAAQYRVRRLIDVKLIHSEVHYRGGVPARVVTVLASQWAGASAGKSTFLKGLQR